MPASDPLAPDLISDELFDLTLYREIYAFSSGDLKAMLAELIPVEERHYAFWQTFFDMKVEGLDFKRRLRLRLLSGLCRVFGPTAVHLILEAIEVHGIRKYLQVWERHKGGPLGKAVKDVLDDEFKHEDAIVSSLSSRAISPERIRNIFLGFNDGLVEIMGALSGFFAAFHEPRLVLMAGASVSVAGALSMAAGAFAASSSEREMQDIARRKAKFLGEAAPSEDEIASPPRAALVVGSAYLIGAMVPVLPVLLGAGTMLVSALTGGLMIVLVSAGLAFLSGMDVLRRIRLNLILMTGAVAISYAIGSLAKSLWGIGL